MVICSSREIARFEVIEVLKEAEGKPEHEAVNEPRNGHSSDASPDEPSRRFISDLRVLSVTPTIKTATGEPVWKLGVQFPWSEHPELHYLPIVEGAPAPKVGTYGAILEKGKQRKQTPGSKEEHFEWSVITLESLEENPHVTNGHTPNEPESTSKESLAENPPMVNGHTSNEPEDTPKESLAEKAHAVNGQMSNEPENTSMQPVQPVQKPVFSERDAELKAHVALKASAEMVSGYLASSGQFKRDYTWKDMVEIATTVADAFLTWIDDATERQMAQHSIAQTDVVNKVNADDNEAANDASNIHPNGSSH